MHACLACVYVCVSLLTAFTPPESYDSFPRRSFSAATLTLFTCLRSQFPSVVSGTISCRGPEEERLQIVLGLGFMIFFFFWGGGGECVCVGLGLIMLNLGWCWWQWEGGEHSRGLRRKAGAPGKSESRLFWRSLTVSRTRAAWSKLTNGFQTQASKTHQFKKKRYDWFTLVHQLSSSTVRWYRNEIKYVFLAYFSPCCI